MADFFNSHHHWQRMSSSRSISLSKLSLADGPWRGTVLQLLESRDNDELMPYCDYEQAVDKVDILRYLSRGYTRDFFLAIFVVNGNRDNFS